MWEPSPGGPPGAPNSLCLMTAESHYSSLSCKQLSTALIRATEECRELSPPRGGRWRGRGASSQRGLQILTGTAASRLAHLPGTVSPAGAWPAVLPSQTRVPHCSGSLLHGDNEKWAQEVALL